MSKKAVENTEKVEIDTKNEESTTEKAEKSYLYVGPPLKNGLIKEGQIVKNFKEFLAEELEKAPNLEKLFIDTENLHENMKEVEKPGSVYKIYYEEVLNVI